MPTEKPCTVTTAVAREAFLSEQPRRRHLFVSADETFPSPWQRTDSATHTNITVYPDIKKKKRKCHKLKYTPTEKPCTEATVDAREAFLSVNLADDTFPSPWQRLDLTVKLRRLEGDSVPRRRAGTAALRSS
ncbi:hypothetical protein Bbelb_375800 [Branchiostoma belcheri]|nr:hypothetical protein Bbelb_375800 [Branchiostoma belcheri]